MNQSSKDKGPIRNLDLEKFRVQHGMTISNACEAFGLQRARWTALQKKPNEPLEDMAVLMTLRTYQLYPETIPIGRVTDVRPIMALLGLDPAVPADKSRFAVMCGREKAAAYRWIDGPGVLSKPVERLIEAVRRLPTESGRKMRAWLEDRVHEAAWRQGIRDPFSRGSWRREGDQGDEH